MRGITIYTGSQGDYSVLGGTHDACQVTMDCDDPLPPSAKLVARTQAVRLHHLCYPSVLIEAALRLDRVYDIVASLPEPEVVCTLLGTVPV